MCPPSSAFKSTPSKATAGTSKGTCKTTGRQNQSLASGSNKEALVGEGKGPPVPSPDTTGNLRECPKLAYLSSQTNFINLSFTNNCLCTAFCEPKASEEADTWLHPTGVLTSPEKSCEHIGGAPRRAAKYKANATSASNGYYSQDLDDFLESAGEAVKPDTPKPRKPWQTRPISRSWQQRRDPDDLDDFLDSDDQDIRPKTSRSRLDPSKKSNKKRDSEPASSGSKNGIDGALAEDNDGDHVVQTATSLRNTQKIPKKGVSTAPEEDGDLATEDYYVHDEAAEANVDNFCLVSDQDIMLDNYDEPDDDSEFEDDFESDDDFECLLNELFVSDESDTEGDNELDDTCLSGSESEPERKRQCPSPAQTAAEAVVKMNEQYPVAADDPDEPGCARAPASAPMTPSPARPPMSPPTSRFVASPSYRCHSGVNFHNPSDLPSTYKWTMVLTQMQFLFLLTITCGV